VENPSGGSGSQQYTADEDCEWLLLADEGLIVEINITSHVIQNYNDALYAYDGDASNSLVRCVRVCVK
jgi:hypothetical protein